MTVVLVADAGGHRASCCARSTIVRIEPFRPYATLVGVSSPRSDPRLSQTSFVVLGLIEQANRPPRMTSSSWRRSARATSGRVPAYAALHRVRAARRGGAARREARADGPAPAQLPAHRRRPRGARRAGAPNPSGELYELRDEGLLKLFFGADPVHARRRAQLRGPQRRLAGYEVLLGAAGRADDRGPAPGAGGRHRPRAGVRALLAALARSAGEPSAPGGRRGTRPPA